MNFFEILALFALFPAVLGLLLGAMEDEIVPVILGSILFSCSFILAFMGGAI